MKKLFILLIIIFCCKCSCLFACSHSKSNCNNTTNKTAPSDNQSKDIPEILNKLNQATENLKSLSSSVIYTFIQDPELLDSTTIRKGMFHYRKTEDQSIIRIDFETLKQDEEDEIKQKEIFQFDGIWLSKVDYQLKKVDHYQKAPADEPIDVFSLISNNFPLIGFSQIDEMEKDFTISLKPDTNQNSAIVLILNVKKDSKYKDDYTFIEFHINPTLYLPVRIITESINEDIYDIVLPDITVNKNIKNSVFKLETPKDFIENKHNLEIKQ